MHIIKSGHFTEGMLVRVSRDAAFFGSREVIGQFAVVTKVDEPSAGYENVEVRFNDPNTILGDAQGLESDFEIVKFEDGDRIVHLGPDGTRIENEVRGERDFDNCQCQAYVKSTGEPISVYRIIGCSTPDFSELLSDILNGTKAERSSLEFSNLTEDEKQVIRDYRLLRVS